MNQRQIMDANYLNLATDDIESYIRDRLPNGSCQYENLNVEFEYSHGSLMRQLDQLQEVLMALGSHVKYVGLHMMGAMNNEKVSMETVKSVYDNCPNLKGFYAASLFIRNEQFCLQTLQPLFERLETIFVQIGGFEGLNTFANCKNLKEWTLEIVHSFPGKCLNFNFPELRSINFSKVNEIDNEHLEPFFIKNPQLKSLTLTRCEIDSKILELISRHVHRLEEISLNFRRSLVHRSDLQKNKKYLRSLRHLKAMNFDCYGIAMGECLLKMAAKEIPLNRVGLFCCPWEDKLTQAFANLKYLKSLHLANITGLSDDCLGRLSESLIGVTDLTLKYIHNITIDGVIKLIIECQRLRTVNLFLKIETEISTSRYNLLLETIKNRKEKSKVTITLWGRKQPLKLSKDLLKQNLEFLEFICEEHDLNKNTGFDFFCDSTDGGYDLVVATPVSPPPICSLN